jgi:alkyl hydroperoxide reductase subunit AhpF
MRCLQRAEMRDMSEYSSSRDRQSGQTPRLFDVAIVGGGVAGSAAAAVLGRTGVGVVSIDLHETFPPDFRADKVAGDQIDLMKRLGLFDVLAQSAATSRSVVNIRRGRVLDRHSIEEYNLPYEDLVNAVRRAIPDSVARVAGRVADIEASADAQRILMPGSSSSRPETDRPCAKSSASVVASCARTILSASGST